MHRLLLVFLAAAGASVLGLPRLDASPAAAPCLAPQQWEGRWVMFDHSSGRNSRASVSYDGLKQRIRVLQQNKKHAPCQRFYEYIYLYQSMVMFQIDQKTKACSKIALSGSWDPFDIPDNSTFEDQYDIGGPGDSVEVQEWSDRKPARQHETWVGVYTLKDCYPVQETYAKNSSVITSTRFFDLHLGISDPDVFTPPATCQSARPERMAESHC
ncbi:mammalian ependymin-related protein 1 [Pseudoliparis swirei]|uniref:mammalian ependymin-related protein 1 n=1 Tax=Pseudoliparis swirei TaxID=2059687 RepID=UPI0024BEAC02|nr:mammalian ependymin-related protein 1 [Pseudoliparis swirei]